MPLKRVITLREALAINIGAIIGGGIFAISGLAAGIAGPSTIISIILGAVISMLTGMSFAQLASIYSNEGGNYIYARSLLGRYAGVIAGVMFIVASIIGGAAVALSFGSYFAGLFGASLSVPAIAAALIIALSIVNYLGVKHSADASLVLTVIKVIILGLFVAIGVFYIKPSNYSPFLPSGLSGMFAASAFIFFAYSGFARVTTLGEEVDNPKKTIPKTIIYSIIISALIYALVMVVMIGTTPYAALSASQSPLEYAILYATHNALLGYVISLGALFATVNVVLSMVLGISRVTFAMSRGRDLPKALAKINRFGAPDTAIIISAAVMVISIVLLNFKQIVAISVAAVLMGYTIANLAAIRLELKGSYGKVVPFFRSRYFLVIPVTGAICTVALLLFLPASSLYLLVVLLALITLVYVIAGRKRNSRR